MDVKYNVTGSKRKALAGAVSEFLGQEVVYKGAPTFAYSVSNYLIDKNGTLSYYGPKVWHSTDKYRKLIWRCNKKYADGKFCETPHVREEELKSTFIQAVNQILGDKNQYVTHIEELLPSLADTSVLEKKRDDLQNEHDAIVERLRRYMEENTRGVQNQEEYNRRFGMMKVECKELKIRIMNVNDEIFEQSARKEKIRRFLDELRQMNDLVTEFDEKLWHATVELVIVNQDKSLTFIFRDGTRITSEAVKAK